MTSQTKQGVARARRGPLKGISFEILWEIFVICFVFLLHQFVFCLIYWEPFFPVLFFSIFQAFCLVFFFVLQ